MHINRLFIPPQASSYFLFGPRGTGKSSFLKSFYSQSLQIDLLKESTFQKFSTNPDLLLEIVQANREKKIIIIDEIQRIPALLNIVHFLLEEPNGKQLQFILTGSSSRKLKSKGVNLLAGRALLKTFHPFMACELQEHFNFEKMMKIGLLPLVWDSKNPEEVLLSYIGLYLKEEVKQEGLVRNLYGFSKFLEAMSFCHAQLVNLSKVASDCGLKRSTITGYFEILEDLLLGTQIRSFKRMGRKEVVEHGKFYYFDVGVFRSLRPSGIADFPEQIDGAAIEGLVFQHLNAWASYRNLGIKIYFWRTKNDVEVDFIIYSETEFYAIEVKRSKNIHISDLKGLKSFKDDYPQCKTILLYLGEERLQKDFILCINLIEFLKKLNPHESLDDIVKAVNE